MTASLIEQVRAFCIQHYQLFMPGPLVVAVSGGADSLTLLHVLIQLREEFGLVLHVATFDHGIRGETSAADVRFVQDIGAQWGVPVIVGSADVPALARTESLNLEAAARRARYAFLQQTAVQVGATRIALGHNQDDQAETVLMHVIRGSGLAGLRGMLPRTPLNEYLTLYLIRPLLDTPRTEIDQYVRDLGISSRVDETNADMHYTRNRLRHQILPLLETINPQVRRALAHTGKIARDEYRILDSAVPPLSDIRQEPNGPLYGLCTERYHFRIYSEALQRLLIRSAVQQLAPDLEISYEQTMAAVALVDTHEHGVQMPLGGGLSLRMVYGMMIIDRDLTYPSTCPSVLPGSRLEIPEPGVYLLPGSGWQLRVERLSAHDSVEIPPDPLAVVLATRENPRFELRTRQAGDRFRPHGAGGHSQKLSDTLTNMKVPAVWRDSVPLLTINGEIAWFVAPFAAGPRSRVSERFAVQVGEAHDIWQFTFVPPKT